MKKSSDIAYCRERMLFADQRGNDLLSQANEASEAGKRDKAERLYERGQFWLNLSTRYRELLAGHLENS